MEETVKIKVNLRSGKYKDVVEHVRDNKSYYDKIGYSDYKFERRYKHGSHITYATALRDELDDERRRRWATTFFKDLVVRIKKQEKEPLEDVMIRPFCVNIKTFSQLEEAVGILERRKQLPHIDIQNFEFDWWAFSQCNYLHVRNGKWVLGPKPEVVDFEYFKAVLG